MIDLVIGFVNENIIDFSLLASEELVQFEFIGLQNGLQWQRKNSCTFRATSTYV
jgi:hypothetical protein